MAIFRLQSDLAFPPPNLARDDGLLAVGGDLSRDRLLRAYELGIFPWYSDEQPILWWSPDPRMVLFPDSFYVPQRLRRTIRSGRFRITMDEACADVILACATVPRPGQDGTWITTEMADAYIDLHEEGYTHSVEAWEGERLAGGLYGVSLGACFFGESMFSRERDASKVAMAALVSQVRHWDFAFIDCQIYTQHLYNMGAREIPRRRFLDFLARAMQTKTIRGKWRFYGFPDEAD